MSRRVFVLALGFVLVMFGVVPPPVAKATVLRTFAVRYTSNQPGDITIASNTSETCPPAAPTCAAALNGTAVGGNLNDNNYAMQFVDVDGDATTFNSSTADLVLPFGSSVLFAGLYWAGTTVGATAPPNLAGIGTVKFKVPGGGAYLNLTSTQTDQDPTGLKAYQGFVDVTSQVQAAGAGTYTTANVQAAQGANMDAGWALVVAYADPPKPARNLTVFDGFGVVNSALAPVDIPVSGFTTPPSGPVNTKLGVFAMDGDRGSTGDSLSLNGQILSDGLNPPDNFFNSTVSALGTSITNRNPSDNNTLGLDADIVSANGILANGATAATIHLTTGGETYWPGVVTFVTDLYAPRITPTKVVTDINGGAVERGDILKYTVDAANTGQDAAGGVVVTDPIPANTTYVAGSLVIVSGPNVGAKSDSAGNDQAEYDGAGTRVVFRLGTGANAAIGGTLASVGQPNDQSSFSFEVSVNPGAPAGTTISNLAKADYYGVTLGPGIPFSGTAGAPTTTAVSDVDLAVTKTVDVMNPIVGDVLTYTIGIHNYGPSGALNTVVTDQIPAGTTVVGHSETSGVYAPGTGLWTLGTMPSGGTATLTLQVRVTAAGPIVNTATAASSTPDRDSSNNTATISTADPLADLVVTKTVSAPAAPVGTNVTFTIGLRNAGPSNATTIVLSDLLPPGLQFVSAVPASGAYSGVTGHWTVPALANGASTSLAIVAKVTAAGLSTNVAAVSSLDQADPNPANSSASASVTGQTADLALTKTVDNANPVNGSNIIYTLSVTNHGPAAAAGTVVADPIPSGVTFTSAVASVGAYNAVTGVWSVGALASGASATLALHVKVTTAGTVTNVATASSNVPDPNPGNNQATVSTPNQVADLSITKTVAPLTTAVGGNVVYTITLANAGPNGATNVVVDELLPSGLQFVSAVPSVGTYDSAAGTWHVASLASGANGTLLITATVLNAGPTTNNAQAVSLDQVDPNPANNSASATVTGQSADLSVTKSVDNALPNLGTTIHFTIHVANAGPDAAPGVELTDQLPAGLTFVSAATASGTYTAATGVWAVGTINSGVTDTLTITALVNSTGPSQNSVQVSLSGLPDPDSTPDNNVTTEDDQATATVTVAPAADLSLTKTVGSTDGVVGQPITFTVDLHNAGPNPATNVVIHDPLPAGLTFVSAVSSAGTYDGLTGDWTVPGLGNGADATLVITATVSAVGPGTNTAEVTASDQFDPDSTPNNQDPAEDDQASVAFTRRLASADLSLTKTPSPASVTIGSNVVFTLVVANGGPDPATGVSVKDLLGAGFSFVSATGPGSYNPVTGIWTVGTVTPGGTATLQLTAKATAVGPESNTAEVWTANEADPDSTPGNGISSEDDQATAAITVTSAPTPPPTSDLTQLTAAGGSDMSLPLILAFLAFLAFSFAFTNGRARRRAKRPAYRRMAHRIR